MNTLPRVTLAVVAFNQESFVREAIAGALAQNYPNLQIVLSDDGSSDDTFAIMAAAAAEYAGPHTIVLNRRSGGEGVLAHLLDAVQFADGDLFVGAAGDDISLPNRVSLLVEHWRRDRPAAIYSAWNRVDVDGRFLSRDGIADQNDRDLAAYFPDRRVVAAFGCTTAYSTAFLRSVPSPAQRIWSEDYFLSLAAMLTGETITYIDEPLVLYRQNPKALRNYATSSIEFLAYEERESRFFDGLAAMLVSLLEMIDRGVPPARTRVDRAAVLRDITWYRYRAEWSRRGLVARLRYTAELRTGPRLRWAIPRLIGIASFLKIKAALAEMRGAGVRSK